MEQRPRDDKEKRIAGVLRSGTLALFLAVLALPATFMPLDEDDDLTEPKPSEISKESVIRKCRPGRHLDVRNRPECLVANLDEGSNSPDGDLATGVRANGSTEDFHESRNPGDGPRYQKHGRPAIGSVATPRPGITIREQCAVAATPTNLSCTTSRIGSRSYVSTDSNPTDVDSGFEISGQIVADGGDPLNDISVVAAPKRLRTSAPFANHRVRYWTKTDSLGHYTLAGLPEGEYSLHTSARPPYGGSRITARTGSENADLIVSELIERIIDGQVLSSSGEPLEAVTVAPFVLGQPSTQSDSYGHYRVVVKVDPHVDSVKVRFHRPGYQELAPNVRLSVSSQAGTTKLDAVLHPVDAFAGIAGRVSDERDAPLRDKTVELRSQSARTVYKTTTQADGSFFFPMVEAPADYNLFVAGGSTHQDFRQRVHITSATAELNVVTRTFDYGEVSGELVNVHGAPIPEFDLLLRHASSQAANAQVSTDALGRFEIANAPAGEFVLASQSTPAILVRGLELGANEHIHLPVVLDWGVHQIRGRVVDSTGNPVAASRVILRWSHDAGDVLSQTTRRTATDTQGQFEFANLGPGPHSLLVDAPGFQPVELDHDLDRQGYEVTVKLN